MTTTRSTELSTGMMSNRPSVVNSTASAQARHTTTIASPMTMATAGSLRRTTPTDHSAVVVESSATAAPAAIAAGTASCPSVDMMSDSDMGPRSTPLGAPSAAARPVATANATPIPARMTANSHQANRWRRRMTVSTMTPALTTIVATRPGDHTEAVSNDPANRRTSAVRAVMADASHHGR